MYKSYVIISRHEKLLFLYRIEPKLINLEKELWELKKTLSGQLSHLLAPIYQYILTSINEVHPNSSMEQNLRLMDFYFRMMGDHNCSCVKGFREVLKRLRVPGSNKRLLTVFEEELKKEVKQAGSANENHLE